MLIKLVANAGDVEVIACVPYTNLETAVNTVAGSNVKIDVLGGNVEQVKLYLACNYFLGNAALTPSPTLTADLLAALLSRLLISILLFRLLLTVKIVGTNMEFS